MAFSFRAVLVDYDEPPPDWVEGELADRGIEWVARQHRTPEAALELSRIADVVMIQSVRPLLNQAVIQGLERCRGIVRLGTGYDSVDLASATKLGIPVCNVPAYCTDDVADHALALLMDLAKHVTWHHCSIRSGNWSGTGLPTRYRIKGSTLGLIGFGRIGRALAKRVSGFGMTAITYDPYVDADTISRYGVKKVSLDELLMRAEFISLHPPLTDETYHMLSTSEFNSMKEGVYIVNTSRGPVIDEVALIEALGAGKVAGAGLDVFEEEPPPLDSPLREFDTVILTPHIAFSSAESRIDLYRDACELAVNIVQGIWPETVVNPEVEGKTAYPFQRRDLNSRSV
jgi:D-3-phosphoglycerate dehydrogenase